MPEFREHIEVARALYSVPAALIGQRAGVRADRQLVRVWHRGQLVKVHPRARPGGRVTDPAVLPADKTAYAMRDLGYLQRLADDAGPAVGGYAAALLDHPLPWTRMRQVYVLLGLVRKWGPARVGRSSPALGVRVHERHCSCRLGSQGGAPAVGNGPRLAAQAAGTGCPHATHAQPRRLEACRR